MSDLNRRSFAYKANALTNYANVASKLIKVLHYTYHTLNIIYPTLYKSISLHP